MKSTQLAAPFHWRGSLIPILPLVALVALGTGCNGQWSSSASGTSAQSRSRTLGLPVALAGAEARAHTSDVTSVTINVDANANRKPINPLIYGLSFASTAQLTDLNAPINRSGGDSTTRYNWQSNAMNHAFDYYFESIGEDSATAGEMGDTFISQTHAAGAQPMLTIPMIGWVAKLGQNRAKLASYSQAKYGAQQDADWQWMPDAGNGVLQNGQQITNNDPNDANLPADSAFELGWIQHLTTQWGTAAHGGLRYYILDNEPSIWQATHRDVHPTGANMDEMLTKITDYASKIKANDPSALVVAPEEWGWPGYLYSGYDQQYASIHGWGNYPDRNAHGGVDYCPYLLDQLHQYDVAHGQRLLDVFTLHYYPQGGEFSDDTSTDMQLRRNRSTRSLWDPAYVDETWIDTQIYLIPRMHQWIATWYPGTLIGVTEYNWGAEGHINGATTQADVFGIFGREGLDLSTRWTTPAAGTPVYNAIKMYRNYDGSKSTFGDVSVSASGPNPDQVSTFAATRTSDGALTVMVINKQLTTAAQATIHLANFNAGSSAQQWQLTAANAITHGANVAVSSGAISVSVPAQSITLFVVPPASAPACSYSVAPPSASYQSAGGTGSATVTTTSGCAWTATPSAWITITSGASGTGNGTINYSVAANTGAARNGSITAGGQAVAISQAAPVVSCSYTASPLSANAPSTASTGSVAITTTSGCAWTASSGATWITITSGASGTGNGTVGYSVAANPGAARPGTITAAGKTVTINQAAVVSCSYTASPTSASVGAAASTGSVSVATTAACGWTASSTVTWITITSGASGNGNGTVHYSVSANTGAARTGTIYAAAKPVTISQAAPRPTATVSGGGTSCAGGTVTIRATLTGRAPWALTWSDGLHQAGLTALTVSRNVAPSTTTTYRITAISDSTGTGTTSGSATVTVMKKPVISSQPASSTIARNSSVTLRVTATGGTLSYTWYRGTTGQTTSVVGANSAQLTTPALTATTSYWVKVTNSCGSINSSTATITVH